MKTSEASQFWKLDIDTLKWLHKKNLITATAYLLGIIRGTRGQGWKWTFKVPEFCQEWQISERSFYRAISFLKTHNLIDWRVKGEITIWWNEKAPDSGIASVLPSVAETLPSVAETLPSVAEKTLESVDVKGVQEFPRLYSDIFYRSDSLNSLSDIALADATPIPHPKEEREKEFGFQIAEAVSQSPATLLDQSESTQLTIKSGVEAIVPAAKIDKFFTTKTRDQQKYDRWSETAHPALVYGGDDTPWLEAPTRTEFVKFNKAFIDWHTSRCMEKFHKQDRFQAEGDFKASLINNPERCASRWTEYHKHMVAHAAVAASRANNGIEITQAEKQKFFKHAGAFVCVTTESTESIDTKILDAAKSPATPQLELVATVPDDIWDAIATTTELEQARFIKPPEDAVDTAMYSRTAKPEESDYFRALHEKTLSTTKRSEYPQVIKNLQEFESKTHALIKAKAMPSISASERQRIEEEERLGRKLAHWHSLLQTGIPSVIADVQRQANAQGYVVIDDQISEVDF